MSSDADAKKTVAECGATTAGSENKDEVVANATIDMNEEGLEVIELDKSKPLEDDDDLDGDDADAADAIAQDQYGDDDIDGAENDGENPEGKDGENEAEGESKDAVADESLFTSKMHGDAVYAVAFHPTDEKTAASGGGDDKAFIFNPVDGTVKHTFEGYADSVSHVSFSSDGTLLAVGTMDGEIRIYNSEDGELLHELSMGSDLECLSWHPKGPVLLGGCTASTVWLWDASTGACMRVLSGHKGAVRAAAFTPSGMSIVSASDDGTTIIWNVKSGQPMFTFKGNDGHKAPVACLDVQPVANPQSLMATGALDGSVHIYSLKTGKLVQKLTKPHTESVESIAFSPAVGVISLLATGSVDGFVKIWNTANWQVRTALQHPAAIVKIMWHPKKQVLFTACNDNIIRAWDGLSGKMLWAKGGHEDGVVALDVSLDGSRILTGSDDKTVKLYDATLPVEK